MRFEVLLMGLNNLFPLACLSYVPGSCQETIAGIPDPLTRHTAMMEYELLVGNNSKCIDYASDLQMKADPFARVTATVCRAYALECTGDKEQAAAIYSQLETEGNRARRRLNAGDLRRISSDEKSSAPTETASSDLAYCLAGDLASCELGNLEYNDPRHFSYLSANYSSAQKMLGCTIGAKSALRAQMYQYSAGNLRAMVATSGNNYPLITAHACLVLAIDLVNLGQDEAAKQEFLYAFELLRRDGFYMPMASMYRGLVGLPDACLRKRHPRAYSHINELAVRTAYLGQVSSGKASHMCASPVLTPQESSFAQLAAIGKTNNEIASFMGVSTHTVKYHLANVYSKLGVKGRGELA